MEQPNFSKIHDSNIQLLEKELQEAKDKQLELLNLKKKTTDDITQINTLAKSISDLQNTINVFNSPALFTNPEIFSRGQQNQVAQQPTIEEKPKMEIKPKKVEKDVDEDDDDDSQVISTFNFDDDYSQDDIDEELDDFDFDVPSDVVNLPSKGEIYKHKKGKVQVAYLNASDEDMISSPNLYKDDKILDILLKKKILDKGIKINELCQADRDMILVFLRISAYGPEFPVKVKHPQTGEFFETVIDLNEIKLNEFSLKGDKNGYFDFVLPKTKAKVKFKFFNHKDDLNYVNNIIKTNNEIKKYTLLNCRNSIKEYIDEDKNIDKKIKIGMDKYLENLNQYIENIDIKDDELVYSKKITYRTEKSIISINGNEDRDYIRKFVSMMPAGDALAFRKYVEENQPSINFQVTVTPTENDGGGSPFKTFLELDSSLFLNIA